MGSAKYRDKNFLPKRNKPNAEELRVERERFRGILLNWPHWVKLLGTKHERALVIPVDDRFYHVVAFDRAIKRLKPNHRDSLIRVVMNLENTRLVAKERGCRRQNIDYEVKVSIMEVKRDVVTGWWERPGRDDVGYK